MSNLRIFEARDYDPKRQRIVVVHEVATIQVDKIEVDKPMPMTVYLTNGERGRLTIDGREKPAGPIVLFMEDIEPEGEEDDIYDAVRDLRNGRKLEALENERDGHAEAANTFLKQKQEAEKERDELKAQRDRLLRALDKIRKSKNMDCGCSPCTGQCRGAEALELHIEAICEMAADAILDKPTTPATIPFSWEKYKEGYECQTRDGRKVSQITKLDEARLTHPVVASFGDRADFFSITGKIGSESETHKEDLVLIPPAPVEELWYKNFYPMHSELRHLNIDEGQKYLLLKKTGTEFTSVSIQTL